MRRTPAPRPADPWLLRVLDRGGSPDPTQPWRSGPAAADERALRDGLLQRVVADVVIPADLEVDAALRARALALLLPPGMVVLGAAALWVHLGPPVPSPHEVRVAGHRLPDLPRNAALPVTFSRVRPTAEDLTRIGPLTLTTPARSLLDVAGRHPHRADRLRSALAAAGLLALEDVVLTSRRGRGRAGIRTARRALQIPRAGFPDPATRNGAAGGAGDLRPAAADARP